MVRGDSNQWLWIHAVQSWFFLLTNGFRLHQEENCLTYKTCFWKQEKNTTQTEVCWQSYESISGNLRWTHNTLCWGTCSSGSCKTCWGREDEPNSTEMVHGKQPYSRVGACKLAGCNPVITLTQAGGDTTTWSVWTCWPEAVTTGASVCSCTAVTVPCVCRQGRTIVSQAAYYQYNGLDVESTGRL